MLNLALPLIFLISAVYSQQCPNGYVRHHSSCYAVIVNPKANWPTAQSYCTAANGHLATFEDEAERNYVYNYIANRFQTTHKYYWIGGINFIDGEWVWVNSLNSTNLNWAHGEPTKSADGEHCLLMVATQSGKYADNICGSLSSTNKNEYPFVCEKEIA